MGYSLLPPATWFVLSRVPTILPLDTDEESANNRDLWFWMIGIWVSRWWEGFGHRSRHSWHISGSEKEKDSPLSFPDYIILRDGKIICGRELHGTGLLGRVGLWRSRVGCFYINGGKPFTYTRSYKYNFCTASRGNSPYPFSPCLHVIILFDGMLIGVHELHALQV